MGLLNRLKEEPPTVQPERAAQTAPPVSRRLPLPPVMPVEGPEDRHGSQEIKERIHRRLLDRLDLTKLETVSKESLTGQVRDVIGDLLADETDLGPGVHRDRLAEEILNETFGLGPLEPLLNDPTVSDILVNTCRQVYVERFGKLELTRTVFKDDAHLMHIIDRIVSKIGRRVDESSPMVDARLADGSRVNAIIPPLAIDGPSLSIRKFGVNKITVEHLIRLETLTSPMAQMLEAAVRSRLNILVSGGTGSGKTTLLNIISSFVPSNERIVTIEDAAELQLRQEHVVRLETRPPNIEGRGSVVQRDLVRNALRMRPDRIIVGEVRGAEALDMLQAMNTGHDGSMTTLHANTTRDALRRLETMILMAGNNLTERAMREQISSAINIILQVARMSDGTRKVVKVSEITGMEGDTITLQDIFVFEKMGISPGGRVRGGFRTMGLRPKFAEQLQASGINLPVDLFEPRLVRLAEKEGDEA